MSNDIAGAATGAVSFRTKEGFVAELDRLKAHSSFSFAALGRAIDRPTTTVHGWFSGRHLPYPRDNDDFRKVLELLGVADTQPWMDAVATFRRQLVARAHTNPYRGLMAFAEEDAPLYFGRGEQLAEIVAVVREPWQEGQRPVVVIGASGAGKSSLLRAGVTPRLIGDGTTVRYLTPGLATDDALARLADELDTRDASDHSMVVIVDQFEEVFTAADSEAVSRALAATERIARAEQVTTVICLRADFFQRAAAEPFLLAALQHRQFLIAPLGLADATECIVQPARVAGLEFAPELVSQLIGEFATQSAETEALPMLSEVLYLMAAHAVGSRLDLSTYRAVGGLPHAVEQSAERAYQSLDTIGQAACQRLFSHLVELSADGIATRRRVGFAELEAAEAGDEVDLEPIISTFIEARLLVMETDAVSMSHEVLITAWPRLAAWIDDERESLLGLRRLGDATRVWLDSGESNGTLLTGSRLDAAVSAAAKPSGRGRLTGSELRLISDSVAAERDRHVRRRRRQRLLIALTVATAMFAVAAGVLAISARRSAARERATGKDALSRQLALEATALRDTDPALSEQLAVQAFATAPTAEARSALLDATAGPRITRLLGGAGPTALAASADGRRAAYSDSTTGSVTIVATDNGSFERVGKVQLASADVDPFALALSPDGYLLAVGGTDNAVSLWNISDPSAPTEIDGTAATFDKAVQSLEFDTDGDSLILTAAGTADTVFRWRIDDGSVTALDSVPAAGSTMSIDVSADGQLLAAANDDGNVSLWQIGATAPLAELPPTNPTHATSVTLSPDGTLLAAGYKDRSIRVWNITDPSAPEEITVGDSGFGSWVTSVRFAPDGRRLAASSSDGTVRLWETTTWTRTGPVLTQPTIVTGVRWLDDEHLITTVADGSLRRWDIHHPAFTSLGSSVWSVSYDAAGDRIAAASGVQAIAWQVDDNGTVTELASLTAPNPDAPFSGASAISTDGRRFAAGAYNGDVYVFELDDPTKAPTVFTGLANLVEGVAWSPDGSYLIAGNDDGDVGFWSLDGHQLSVVNIGSLVYNVAISHDSRTIAVAGDDRKAHLFDASDPTHPIELSATVTGDSYTTGVAFAPDDNTLASSNDDKTITLWDITDPTTPQPIGDRLTGPTGRIYSVAFDGTGSYLSAGANDDAVWIWDITAPTEPTRLATLRWPRQPVYAATFSPDGTTIVATGVDQQLYLWHTDTDLARTSICATVGDTITETEWHDYLPGQPYAPACRDH